MTPGAREGPIREERKERRGRPWKEGGGKEDRGRRVEEEERTRRTEGRSDGKGAGRNTKKKCIYTNTILLPCMYKI